MHLVIWQQVSELARDQRSLPTKQGAKFRLLEVNGDTLTFTILSSKKTETIQRKYLEQAARLLDAGDTLDGPGDYRKKVYDQRPAYAWALLKHLGYIK